MDDDTGLMYMERAAGFLYGIEFKSCPILKQENTIQKTPVITLRPLLHYRFKIRSFSVITLLVQGLGSKIIQNSNRNRGGVWIKDNEQRLPVWTIIVIIAVIGIISSISGCVSSSTHNSEIGSASGSESGYAAASSTSQASDELVVNVYSHTGEPKAGFDPLMGWGCGHVNFEPLIQSTLFKSADDGTIINDLATDYSVSPDARTWTVNIREDVKFTDREKLTAKDVAFTFNSAIGSNSELDMSNLENATALNDTAVDSNSKNPSPVSSGGLGTLESCLNTHIKKKPMAPTRSDQGHIN